MKRPAKAKDLLTREAAAIIGCDVKLVRELIREGELRAWRLTDGGWYRIFPESFHRFVARMDRTIAQIVASRAKSGTRSKRKRLKSVVCESRPKPGGDFR